MRENRTCGSEGGEAQSLPYPYPVIPNKGAWIETYFAPYLPHRVQLGAPGHTQQRSLD